MGTQNTLLWSHNKKFCSIAKKIKISIALQQYGGIQLIIINNDQQFHKIFLLQYCPSDIFCDHSNKGNDFYYMVNNDSAENHFLDFEDYAPSIENNNLILQLSNDYILEHLLYEYLLYIDQECYVLQIMKKKQELTLNISNQYNIKKNKTKILNNNNILQNIYNNQLKNNKKEKNLTNLKNFKIDDLPISGIISEKDIEDMLKDQKLKINNDNFLKIITEKFNRIAPSINCKIFALFPANSVNNIISDWYSIIEDKYYNIIYPSSQWILQKKDSLDYNIFLPTIWSSNKIILINEKQDKEIYKFNKTEKSWKKMKNIWKIYQKAAKKLNQQYFMNGDNSLNNSEISLMAMNKTQKQQQNQQLEQQNQQLEQQIRDQQEEEQKQQIQNQQEEEQKQQIQNQQEEEQKQQIQNQQEEEQKQQIQNQQEEEQKQQIQNQQAIIDQSQDNENNKEAKEATQINQQLKQQESTTNKTTISTTNIYI